MEEQVSKYNMRMYFVTLKSFPLSWVSTFLDNRSHDAYLFFKATLRICIKSLNLRYTFLSATWRRYILDDRVNASVRSSQNIVDVRSYSSFRSFVWWSFGWYISVWWLDFDSIRCQFCVFGILKKFGINRIDMFIFRPF